MRLKEVAKTAGVSLTTASDILNRGRGALYDPQTCSRVLTAARREGYRPSRAGRVLRTQKTDVIGFVAANYSPDEGQLEHFQVYPFLVGMSHHLTAHGYHLALMEFAELAEYGDARDRLGGLYERFLDGVVVHANIPPSVRRALAGLAVPVVWWDAERSGRVNCLRRDEVAVTRMLLEALFARGHRRIAYMVGQRGWELYRAGGRTHFSYVQRYETYRELMRQQGCDELPLTGYAPDSLAAQMQAYDATAVIIHGGWSHPLALAAARLGWQIPRDLSVASTDCEVRIPSRGPVQGGVTYDRYAIGQRAAQMMLEVLRTGRSVPSVFFVGTFQAGDTIAAARDARGASGDGQQAEQQQEAGS